MYGKINNGQFSQAPSVVIYQSQKYINPTNDILEALGYLLVVDDVNTLPQSGEDRNNYTISYRLDDINNRILRVYTKKPVVLTENNYSDYVGNYVESSISDYVNEHKSEWTTPIYQPTDGDDLIPISLTATKTKIIYNQDETINLNDLTVVCNYSNNTSAAIVNYTTNISEINTSFSGYQPLIITYTHNGITVTTKIKIVINNTDAYDNKQIAYRQARSGLIINGVPIITNTEKLYQYSQLKFRIDAHFTIEQNSSNSNVVLGFGNKSIWGGNTLGNTITLQPHEVGEFDLTTNLTINFNQTNVNVDSTILTLYNNGGNNIQGMFEIKNVSLCCIAEVEQIPISLTATKIQQRAIIGETIIYDDITAVVKFNDESQRTVDPIIDPPSSLTVGNNKFKVSYTQNGKTVSTNVNMTLYQADKTEPDTFEDKTAWEWCNQYCHKAINWGNELDSKGNSNNTLVGDTSHVGDNYMNQETLWGQPVATLKNFQDILAAGFDCVRIPVTWCYNSYTESELNEDELKVRHIGKFWACRVREVVDLALEAGLSVMINMHHEQPIIFTASSNIAMKQVYLDAYNCWTEIAEKFKHYDQRLIFEGYNEVDNLKASFQFGQEAATQMNMLNQIFVSAVRATGSNNANRVLVCPTTVHMSAPIAIDAWTYPTDTVENHIACAVHNYSIAFVQDLSVDFEKIEKYSVQYNVPIMITEWGTTDTQGDFNFRARHAQNYIARARYHHLFPIWWDNGSNYELVKKYNCVHEYNHAFSDLQKIIDGINKGYSQMKAYKLPDEQIQRWDTFESITPRDWNLDKGFHDSGWGYATTEIFPVQAGKKFLFNVGKSGTTIDAVIQLVNITWLRAVYNEELGENEYLPVDTTGASWHTTSKSGVVPDDANCAVIKTNCADKNINVEQWKKLFGQDELVISFTLYDESDISEIQLDFRHATSLDLTKDQIIYAVGDELNVDDIGVVQIYNDGFTETLSANDYTVDITNADMTTTGIYDLTITSKYGISGTIKIYVGDILMSISTNTQLSSKIGNPISTDGLVVEALYTNGTTQTVEGFTVDTSLVNPDIEGTYPITISYTESGFTATYETTYLVYSKLVVQNIAKWEGSVEDDATAQGWTMEKPNHIGLSSTQGYMYWHILTDADFALTDVTDNAGSNMADRHLFIPTIGRTRGKMTSLNQGQSITASSVNGTDFYMGAYPVSEVEDSLGRIWYKVSISGAMYNNESRHKAIANKSETLPIYYCTENDLGDFEPSRRWGRTYHPADIDVVTGVDIVTSNNVLTGVKSSNTRAMIFSGSETEVPLQLNGETKGYMIAIPEDATRVVINAPNYRIWSTLFDISLKSVKIITAANDKVQTDIVDTAKYITIVFGLSSDLSANLVESGVDASNLNVKFYRPYDAEDTEGT